MSRIKENFYLKDDKIAEFDMYLGATIYKILLEVGKMCWTMLVDKYVKDAVSNIEESLHRD